MLESFGRNLFGKGTEKRPPVPQEVDLRRRERNAIKDLEKPLEAIIEQLGPQIEKGSYSVIVGDDATGRIPAIMMEEVLKTVYATKGHPPPLLRFIAGSSRLHLETGVLQENKKLAVLNQIERIKADAEKRNEDIGKVLIVTDSIATGESVKVLVDALHKNGWWTDVATVSLFSGPLTKEDKENIGARVVAGMEGTPSIYDPKVKHLAGVKKERTELFSAPLRAENTDPNLQTAINASRAVAKDIARHLAERYLKTHEDTTPDQLAA